MTNNSTTPQNPSELAAVVAFGDDEIKWVKFEVRVSEVTQNSFAYTNDTK